MAETILAEVTGTLDVIDGDDLAAMAALPQRAADLATAAGVAAIVVDTAGVDPSPSTLAVLASLATVTVARGGGPLADGCDVRAGSPDDLAEIERGVRASPLAALTLVMLLRAGGRPVAEGLAAESAAYSMLQAGPEFRGWRAATPVRAIPRIERPAVEVGRDGPVLRLTLDRPDRHNAFDVAMRDELFDAFALAAADTSISRVVWRGRGPSFCSGGDLDTFGTSPDPAAAHAIRLARSVGRMIDGIAPKVEVHLHGSCLGAGIELPAFASRVVADRTASIGLPEVSFGLVPGAGGTVSVARRIGRQATAWLALTNARIDAPTALAWGLVDEIT